MSKSRVLSCIFKNVVRIPNDFTAKSNFIHEFNIIFDDTLKNEDSLQDNKKLPINLLFESIIHSNISSYSPYDSALFFHSLDLAHGQGQRVDLKDGLYIRARDLLVRDMANYRNELIPYFFDKLTCLKDANGLAFYISELSNKSIACINPAVLCDIIIKLTKTFKSVKSTTLLDKVLNSDFFQAVVSKLADSSSLIDNSTQVSNQLNPKNIFKAIYGLAKLEHVTENSTKLLKNLIPIVSRHLENHSTWDSKTALKLGWAYCRFGLIDKALFTKIAKLISENLDDFDCKEIGIIQDIYTRDDLWNDKLLSLTKSRLQTFLNYGAYSGQVYKEDDVVSIPPEFIISLAKTHGFIQYGKVDLQMMAAKIIADTVEFRVKQIIQEASKFMYRNARTSNHMSLTSDDIKCALKSLKMADPPGHSDLCDHRYVCADKLYMGNRVIKRESKLLYNGGNWGRYKLSDLVFSPMCNGLSPLPRLTVQWLSVRGTFPLISSNFGIDATDLLAKRAEESVAILKDFRGRKSEYLEKNSQNSNNLLRVRDNDIINRLSKALSDSLNNPISRDINSKPITSVPRVEHVLDKEHHFFLNCVKNTITKSIDLGVIHSSQYKQLAKVLHILSTSLALDQLMPELCFFFSTQINLHIKHSLPHAVSIMLSFAHAIISNPFAHVHFHIHQLLIPILQVAIGKYEFPSLLIYQVLRLRKKAADLVGKIALILRTSRNGLEYIDSQLIVLLKQALSADEMSIFTLYGAIACLSNMSFMSRFILLYPNFNSILSTLIYQSIKTRHLLNIGNSAKPLDNEITDENRPDGENMQLLAIKNIIYNETIQLLLGTLYYSLQGDFFNMPDLFFSNSNSGYSPPFYQPNTNQLLEMLDTFKLFMNGLLYDMFTPFLTAILRKFVQHSRSSPLISFKSIYNRYEYMELTTGHLLDLTL